MMKNVAATLFLCAVLIGLTQILYAVIKGIRTEDRKTKYSHVLILLVGLFNLTTGYIGFGAAVRTCS